MVDVLICPKCGYKFDDRKLTVSSYSMFPASDIIKMQGSVKCQCGTEIFFSKYYSACEDPYEIESVEEEDD